MREYGSFWYPGFDINKRTTEQYGFLGLYVRITSEYENYLNKREDFVYKMKQVGYYLEYLEESNEDLDCAFIYTLGHDVTEFITLQLVLKKQNLYIRNMFSFLEFENLSFDLLKYEIDKSYTKLLSYKKENKNELWDL